MSTRLSDNGKGKKWNRKGWKVLRAWRGQEGDIAARPERSEGPSLAKSCSKGHTGQWTQHMQRPWGGDVLAGCRNSTTWMGWRRGNEGQMSGEEGKELHGPHRGCGQSEKGGLHSVKGRRSQVWSRVKDAVVGRGER